MINRSLLLVICCLVLSIAVPSSAYSTCEGIEDGDTILLTYQGRFDNGTVFDAQQEEEFVVDSILLINGFYNALLGMKIDDRKSFTVHPQNGYQDPSSPLFGLTLHFEVFIDDIVSTIEHCSVLGIQGSSTLVRFVNTIVFLSVSGFILVIGWALYQRRLIRTRYCVHCLERGKKIDSAGYCARCNTPSCEQSFFYNKKVGCQSCGSNQFIRR